MLNNSTRIKDNPRQRPKSKTKPRIHKKPLNYHQTLKLSLPRLIEYNPTYLNPTISPHRVIKNKTNKPTTGHNDTTMQQPHSQQQTPREFKAKLSLLTSEFNLKNKFILSQSIVQIKRNFNLMRLSLRLEIKKLLCNSATIPTPPLIPTTPLNNTALYNSSSLSLLLFSQHNPLTISKSLIHTHVNRSSGRYRAKPRSRHHILHQTNNLFHCNKRSISNITPTITTATIPPTRSPDDQPQSSPLPQFQPFDQHTPLETIKLIRQYILSIQYSILHLKNQRPSHPDQPPPPSTQRSILQEQEIQDHFNSLNQYLTSTAIDPTHECHHEAEFLLTHFNTPVPQSHQHLYIRPDDNQPLQSNEANDISPIDSPQTNNTTLSHDEHFYLNMTILRAYTLFNDLSRATLLALKLLNDGNIAHMNSLSPILCDLASSLARNNQHKLALFFMSALHQKRIPHSKATPFVVIAKRAREQGDLESINAILDIVLTPLEYYRPKEEISNLQSLSQNSLRAIQKNDKNRKRRKLSQPSDGRDHDDHNSSNNIVGDNVDYDNACDGDDSNNDDSVLDSPKNRSNDNFQLYDELQQDSDDGDEGDDDTTSEDNQIDLSTMPALKSENHLAYIQDEEDAMLQKSATDGTKSLGYNPSQHFEAFLNKESSKVDRLRYRKYKTGHDIGQGEETIILRHQSDKSQLHSPQTTNYKDVMIPYKTRHIQSIIASSLAAYTNANLPRHSIQLLLHSAALLNGRSPVSLLGHHDFTHNTTPQSLRNLLDHLKPFLPPHLHQFEVKNLLIAAEKAGHAYFAAQIFNSRLSVTESNFLMYHEKNSAKKVILDQTEMGGILDHIGHENEDDVEKFIQTGVTITSPCNPLESKSQLDRLIISPQLTNEDGINAVPFLSSLEKRIETELLGGSPLPRKHTTTTSQTTVSYEPTQPEAVLGYILDRMKMVTIRPGFDTNTDSHLFNYQEPKPEDRDETTSQTKLQKYANNTYVSSRHGYSRLFTPKKGHSLQDGDVPTDLNNYHTVDGYMTNDTHQTGLLFSKKLYLSRRLFYTDPKHYPLYYNRQHDVNLFPDHLGKQYNLLILDKKMNKNKYLFNESESSNTNADTSHFPSGNLNHSYDNTASLGLNSTQMLFQFAKPDHTMQENNTTTTLHLDHTFTYPSSSTPMTPSSSETALAEIYYPAKNFMATHEQLKLNNIPVYIRPFLKKLTGSIQTTHSLLSFLDKYPTMSSQIKCLLYPELLHQSQSYDWNDEVLAEQMGIVKSTIHTLFRAGEYHEATSLLLAQLTSLTSTAAIIPVVDTNHFIYTENDNETSQPSKLAQRSTNLVSNCLNDVTSIFSTFQTNLHTTQPSLWNMLPSLSQLPTDSLEQQSQHRQVYQGNFVKYLTENGNHELNLITNALFPTLFSLNSTTNSIQSKQRPYQTKYLKGGILNPNYIDKSQKDVVNQEVKYDPLAPLPTPKTHFNPVPSRPTHSLYTQSNITAFLMGTLSGAIELISIDHSSNDQVKLRKNNPAIALALWKIFGHGPNAQLLLPAQLPMFNRKDIMQALGNTDYQKLVKMIPIEQLETPISSTFVPSIDSQGTLVPPTKLDPLTSLLGFTPTSSSGQHHDVNAFLHRSYVLASTLPQDQLEFFRTTLLDQLSSLPFPLKPIKLDIPSSSNYGPNGNGSNIKQFGEDDQQLSVFGQILSNIVSSAHSHGHDPIPAIALFTNSLRPDSALFPTLSPFFYKLYRNRTSAIDLHRIINKKLLQPTHHHHRHHMIPPLDVFDHELTISLTASNQRHYDSNGVSARNTINSPESLITHNDIEQLTSITQTNQQFSFGGDFERKVTISVSSPGLLPFTPRPLLQHGIGYLEGFSPLEFNEDKSDSDSAMIPTDIHPVLSHNTTLVKGEDNIKIGGHNSKEQLKHQQTHLKTYTSHFKSHVNHGQLITTDALSQSLTTAMTELFVRGDLDTQDVESRLNGKLPSVTTPITNDSMQSLTFIINTIASLMQTDKFQYPSSYYYTTAFQKDQEGLVDGLKHFALYNQTLQKFSSPLLSLHISLSHRLIANPIIARMVSHAALITGQLKLNQSLWDKHYFLTLANRSPSGETKSRPITNTALLQKLSRGGNINNNQMMKRRVIYAGNNDGRTQTETPEQKLEWLHSRLRKVLSVDEWIISTSIPQIPRLGVDIDCIPKKLDSQTLPSYNALAHYNSQSSLKMITTSQTKQLLPFTKRITPITTPEQLEYRILTFLHNKMVEYELASRADGMTRSDFNQEIPLVNAHSREPGRFIGNRIPRWSSGKYEEELLDELIRWDEMENKVVDMFFHLGILPPTYHKQHMKNRIKNHLAIEQNESCHHNDHRPIAINKDNHSHNSRRDENHLIDNNDSHHKPLLSTQIDGTNIAKSLQKNNKNILLLLVQQVEAVHGDESYITKNNIFYQLHEKQQQLPKDNHMSPAQNMSNTNNANNKHSKHESPCNSPPVIYPSLPETTQFNYHTDLTHEQKLLLVSETLRLDSTLELRYFFESFTNKLSMKSLLYSHTSSLSHLSPHQRAVSRSLNYVTTAIQSGFPQLASLYILKSLSHPQFRQFLGFQTLNHGHLAAYRNSIQTHPLFFIVQNALSQMTLEYPALAYQTYLHCESAGLFQPFTDISTLSTPLPPPTLPSSPIEVAQRSKFPTRSTGHTNSNSHQLSAPLPSSSASLFNPKQITTTEDVPSTISNNSVPKNTSKPNANSLNEDDKSRKDDELDSTKLYNTVFIRLLMQSISGVPLFIDANHIYPKEPNINSNNQNGKGNLWKKNVGAKDDTGTMTLPSDTNIQRDKDLLMHMIKTNHPMLIGIDSPFIQRNISHHPFSNVSLDDKASGQQNTSLYQPVQRLYNVTPSNVLAKPQHELDLTNILIDTSPLSPTPTITSPGKEKAEQDKGNTQKKKKREESLSLANLFSMTKPSAPSIVRSQQPKQTTVDPKALVGMKYAGIKLSDLSPNAKKQIGFFGLMLISSNRDTQTQFSYMQPSRWTDTNSSTGSAKDINNNVNKVGLIIEDDPTKLNLTPLDNSDQVGLHLGDYTPSYIYNEVNKEMELSSRNNSSNSTQNNDNDSSTRPFVNHNNTNDILREYQHPLIRKLSTTSGLSLSQMFIPSTINTPESTNDTSFSSQNSLNGYSIVNAPIVTLDTSGMFHCTKIFAVKSLYDRNLQHLIKLDSKTQEEFIAYQAKTIISSMVEDAQSRSTDSSSNSNNIYTIQRGISDSSPENNPAVPSIRSDISSYGAFTMDPSQLEHIEQLIAMVSELPHDGFNSKP